MQNIELPKTYSFTKNISYFILFFGIIFTAVGIASIFDHDPKAPDAALGGFMFGIPTLLGGFLLWRSAYKKSKDALEQYYEELIFNHVKIKDGIVNSIEVGLAANIPKLKAEQLLNEMVIKGTALTQVNDNGFVEYVFPVFVKDN